jgi:lysophospholipase L1-like esterase
MEPIVIMKAVTSAAVVGFLSATLAGCAAHSGEPTPAVVRANATIVIVGDSISTGAAASRADKGYVARLTSEIHDHSVMNYSRGGWSVHATRTYVGPANVAGVPPLWPRVIILALGTNDFSVDEPLEDFRTGYRSLLRALLSALEVPLDELFCITPFSRLDEDRENKVGHVLDDYRRVIEEECSMVAGIPLDGSRAVPPCGAYFGDVVHPNDRGHARIAAWLLDRLRAHGVGLRSGGGECRRSPQWGIARSLRKSCVQRS